MYVSTPGTRVACLPMEIPSSGVGVGRDVETARRTFAPRSTTVRRVWRATAVRTGPGAAAKALETRAEAVRQQMDGVHRSLRLEKVVKTGPFSARSTAFFALIFCARTPRGTRSPSDGLTTRSGAQRGDEIEITLTPGLAPGYAFLIGLNWLKRTKRRFCHTPAATGAQNPGPCTRPHGPLNMCRLFDPVAHLLKATRGASAQL